MIENKFLELMNILGLSKDKELRTVNDSTLTADGNEWFTLLSQYSFTEGDECLPGWYFVHYEDCHVWNELFKDMDYEPLNKIFMVLTDLSDGGCGVGLIGAPYEGEIINREIHAPWAIGFDNLEALLDTAIACRKEGVWDENSDPDFDKFYKISYRMNSKYDIWNE